MKFEELNLSKSCNIPEQIEIHSGQAGYISELRSKTLHELELAKDNVKYVNGLLSMEVRKLGYIPDDTNPDNKIKVTEAAISQYVDSHLKMVEARTRRADAEMEHDSAKALFTAWVANKDKLTLLQSSRKNEFYSEPTENEYNLI